MLQRRKHVLRLVYSVTPNGACLILTRHIQLLFINNTWEGRGNGGMEEIA